MVVLGIEHLRDGFGHRVLLLCAQILALRKERHVERHGGLRVPEAQRVDMLRAVARDLHVAGDSQHLGLTLGHDMQPPVVPELADRAAEADGLGLLRLGQQPRAAEVLPVVRQLDLLAVDDALAENAELIADGIARGGDVERCHRVEIARGQAAEAAVAETRVGLAFKDVRCAEAQLVERFGQNFADA